MDILKIEVKKKVEEINTHKEQIKFLENEIMSLKNKYCSHKEITMCKRLNYQHCDLCGIKLTDLQINEIKPKITYRTFT